MSRSTFENIEEVMQKMPDDHPFRLAVLNVQSSLVVARELLKTGPSSHPQTPDIIKVATLILEQDAYFSEEMDADIVGDVPDLSDEANFPKVVKK